MKMGTAMRVVLRDIQMYAETEAHATGDNRRGAATVGYDPPATFAELSAAWEQVAAVLGKVLGR